MSKITTVFRIVSLVKNFPIWFINKLNLKKSGYSIYNIRNNLKYKLHNNSFNADVVNHLWNYDAYRVLNKNLKNDSIILDIGAHAGVFSIMCSYQMKSSGKIYAFEPLTDNYNLLIENIKLNNLKNIILIKKAVCNINGKRKLFAYKKDSVGPSFHKHLDGHPFTVDCITLNDLIKSEKLKKIDLIKLDCEGSEYEIIYNFLKKIFKYYKTFFNGSS